MKRFLLAFVIVLLVPVTAYCQDSVDNEQYNEYLNQYDFSFFEETIGDEAYSVLEELGINDFNLENLTSLSFNDFVNLIGKMIEGKIQTPLESSLAVLAFVILSSFFQTFKTTTDNSLSSAYSTVSSLIIAIVLSIKMSTTITICASTVTVASDFVYAFIPVFCAIVATSGGVTTAFSTNSTLLILAQGLSFVASNIFIPIINCFLAIGICSSLRKELNLDRLVYTLKRIITTCISFCSAAFVSILSVKTAVASRADALGLRSIRFAINTVVPVIGSAISEGLLSIQSYSSLIKTSVGVVGIIAVFVVFLPSLIEIIVWRVFLSLCVIAGDIFGDSSVSTVLRVFRDAMLLVNVVLILSMMTTIISIGILIATRNG